MATYKTIKIHDSNRKLSWAVQWCELGNASIVVGDFYPTREMAERESQRLNDEAASRSMG